MEAEISISEEIKSLFEELGKSLDISKTQYDLVVDRYKSVGNYLSAEDSELAPYKPEILPQGSFMLGTMIKPIHEDDDLDIDLVCKLEGKKLEWTQFDLKQAVGNRLSNSRIYAPMLDEEGRRCWTLKYAEQANFHLDILPAIVGTNYKIILEKAFSQNQEKNIDELAIHITDKESHNYKIDKNPEQWLKSNPFGYAAWFQEKADISLTKGQILRESVMPVPEYKKDKLPLIRAVQILKRHRDIMFEGDENKPISIAITTLAALSYSKEINLMQALVNIVEKMPNFIDNKYDENAGELVKWIGNPVNPAENFADKWIGNPEKEVNFYNWLIKVREDIYEATSLKITPLKESLKKSYGSDIIDETFKNYGENLRLRREKSELHMAPKTGILGATGTVVRNHNFFGNIDG
ncbi:hypothetical protein GCM10028805_65130 [Spirosoma harenae]